MSPYWIHVIRFGQIHLKQIDTKDYPDVRLATVE